MFTGCSHADYWLRHFQDGTLQAPAGMAQRFIPPSTSLVRDQYDCVFLLEGLFGLNDRDLLPFTLPKNSNRSLTRGCINPFWCLSLSSSRSLCAIRLDGLKGSGNGSCNTAGALSMRCGNARLQTLRLALCTLHLTPCNLRPAGPLQLADLQLT